MNIYRNNYSLSKATRTHRTTFHGVYMPWGVGNMARIISESYQNGFKVVSSVDDDEMTEDEKKQRDAMLADKAVKAMSKMTIHINFK